MYKYINLLGTSILLMSLYITYANWKAKKTKRNFILTLTLLAALILKTICILESSYFIDSIRLNYISEFIIISCIMQIDINGNKKKHINTLISIFYFMFIALEILFKVNKSIIIDSVLDLVVSICIFKALFRLYIENMYIKTNEIKNNLIIIKKDTKNCSEQLNINKKISRVIGDNINKKRCILDTILNESNRCVLMIDYNGDILNDESFSKMWNDYENSSEKISLDIFLKNNIKNKDEFIKNINNVRKNKKELKGELQGKDGRFFCCNYVSVSIEDSDISVICAITDITYKRKSEMKIEENNAKYKTIVDNIPYSILITNSDEILYNNEKNKSVDFNKEDIKNIVLKDSIRGELHYTCQSDENVCLNIDRVNFIEDNEDRELVVIRDISEYKNIINKIEYSKSKYEALVNIIPEGIYILDYEKKLLTYGNKAFFNMTSSVCIEDIKLGDDSEIVVAPGEDICQNVNFTRKVIENNFGEKVYIESGAMIIDINKKIKIIGVARDITEQVKAEQMEREIEEKNRANKIKNEFFINMSHELKTPLNLIYSSNQLLENIYRKEILQYPNGELSRVTSIVKKHFYILRGLIDNIIDLAKLESDLRYTDKDYYNIVEIVEDVAMKINEYIRVNDMEIVFDTDDEEKIAQVAPDDIEGIILTLLSVVVRYSLSGSTIYLDLYSEKGKSIISIKNKEKYDSVRYINDSERRNLDIGLMASKSIINLYKGNIDIKVESQGYIEVLITIPEYNKIVKYNNRVKNKSEEFIYAEYTRMCNF